MAMPMHCIFSIGADIAITSTLCQQQSEPAPASTEYQLMVLVYQLVSCCWKLSDWQNDDNYR